MKNFILTVAFLTIATVAHAKFEVHTSVGYESSTDGKTKNVFTDMTGHFFVGASFDTREQVIIGQSVSSVSSQFKTTTTDKLSTLELGPRLNYYLNNDKTFFVALTWNPYAKGTRTVAGTAEKISGWSYLASIGAGSKMGGNFFLGASLNYHSLSITESVVGTTSTTVSNAYSSLMPMLNVAYRFR